MIAGRRPRCYPRRRLVAVSMVIAVCAGGCATRATVLGDGLGPPQSTASTVVVAAAATTPAITAAPTTTAPLSNALTTTRPPATTAAFVVPASGTITVRTPSGILALWRGYDAAGNMIVSTPCDRTAVVARSPVVHGVDILLDPGHGGLDPGAIAASGMTEAEINLDVASRVQTKLRAAGRTVEMTRDGDYFRTLVDRAQLATTIAPKAFVSIHHTRGIDAPSEAGIGTEIYHQRTDAASRRLGGVVYKHLEAALSTFDVAWTRSAHFGVRYRANAEGTDFYGVLRRSAGVPAILIESSYLSNAKEAAVLATDRYRDAEAKAIADGIIDWLTTPDTGSGYQSGFVESGSGGDSDLRSCRDPRLS